MTRQTGRTTEHIRLATVRRGFRGAGGSLRGSILHVHFSSHSFSFAVLDPFSSFRPHIRCASFRHSSLRTCPRLVLYEGVLRGKEHTVPGDRLPRGRRENQIRPRISYISMARVRTLADLRREDEADERTPLYAGEEESP